MDECSPLVAVGAWSSRQRFDIVGWATNQLNKKYFNN